MTETVNVELLEELYRWAEASSKNLTKFFEEHPEYAKHNQGAWGEVIKNGHCQTAFCLAGQTAVHSGYTFVENKSSWNIFDDEGIRTLTGQTMIKTDQVHARGLSFVKGTGKTFAHGSDEAMSALFDTQDYRCAFEVAREVLGIKDHEATRLFSGSNELEDIAYCINDIFVERGLPNRVGRD